MDNRQIRQSGYKGERAVSPAQLSKDAHRMDDVDTSPEAHHHRIGWGGTQAASGAVVRKILISDWKLLPITANWTAIGASTFPENIQEYPAYRYVNDFVELRGRCDRADGLTYNTSQVLATLTDMPAPRIFSGGMLVLTSSSSTAGGTNAASAIQLNTTGVITVIPGTGGTAQRWLHLNGVRFDIGQLGKRTF